MVLACLRRVPRAGYVRVRDIGLSLFTQYAGYLGRVRVRTRFRDQCQGKGQVWDQGLTPT